MNRRFATLSLLATLLLAGASLAFAEDYPQIINAKPMFKAGPQHPASPNQTLGAHLVQWNGSFIDHKGAKQTFTMVGTNPATTNVTTTTEVWVIPVKFILPERRQQDL